MKQYKHNSFFLYAVGIGLLPVFYAVVRFGGGTQSALPHIFYIPIIYTSLVSTWYLSAGVALASGFLLSEWLMPLDSVMMIPQTTATWVFRLLLFLGISLWTSYVINYLRRKSKLYEDEALELAKIQQASVSALVDLAEMRDHEFTGLHSNRLSFYAETLSRQLGLEEQTVRNIVDTISLHDIGKVGVPDAILNKPAKLTADEWEIIKRHPVHGAKILDSIARNAQISNQSVAKYLQTAREIILRHHEKYDGSGYPDGLEGEEIPISARVAAVCDVYDSLRSRRPYKDPFPHEQAVEIIRAGKGTHFDPTIVETFDRIADQFAAIWEEHKEHYDSQMA